MVGVHDINNVDFEMNVLGSSRAKNGVDG